ncbi:DUF1403 family protein [Roseivivax sp. GX 12232]|uniref:DUF1403 family protein n=1 Tax=Roseivivax sp. GX 12232 TaxID=2900547 RepID=UPI001E45C48A|nr:DUF1403 family protein [Roseivivax sp. GX 12232]MCE0507278.1 DUF1403 family protein [Roseivivax sp. GX 12232]
MSYARLVPPDPLEALPRLPSWVTSGRAESLTDMAFQAGAALSHLHIWLARDEVPRELLRQRLALQAAERCVMDAGRPERTSDIRDEVHLLRAGEQPGPAGAVFLTWSHMIRRPISVGSLSKALPMLEAEQIAEHLDAGQGAPIARATQILEAVMGTRPRETMAARLLADAALAQALGWTHVVPLLSIGLPRKALRGEGGELISACYEAVWRSSQVIVQMSDDLARRAAKLQAVAPKLRSKGADQAVQLLLTRDAISPTVSMAGIMSDRSARRFCDRLLELGIARELTGRDAFRIYGV